MYHCNQHCVRVEILVMSCGYLFVYFLHNPSRVYSPECTLLSNVELLDQGNCNSIGVLL